MSTLLVKLVPPIDQGQSTFKDSHSAVPFTVDRVTTTSRSRVPVCTDTVTLTLPASSLAYVLLVEQAVSLNPITTTEMLNVNKLHSCLHMFSNLHTITYCLHLQW